MADQPGPRGLALMRWIIAFLVICSIFMLLRLYAARLIKRKWFADDVFSAIGYAATVSQGAVTIWAIYHGAGKHQADLPLQDIALILKVLYGHSDIILKEVDTDSLQMFAHQIFQLPCAITWLVGTVSVKIAMLCLYTRIFTTRQFRRWAYSLMAAVAIYFVAFLILFMTNCIPLSHLWNPVPGGWCRAIEIEEYTSVVFNLMIDLCIVILPMPSLWNLKMPLRNKFFVSIMFSIGLITIGVMCWKLEATTATLNDPDFTHYFTDIGNISAAVLPVDITDEAALNKASAAVGKWDILVLAAGYSATPGPMTEADTDEWWQGFEFLNLAELGFQQTNVKGTFLALKAFMPFAEPSHATVLSLVTGMAALPAKNLPNLSSYLASKLAQTKVIEFLPVENPNIFAATIHPGMVETAIFNKSGADSTKLPMDKVELSAHFIVWMSSQEASFLNGRCVWANWDVEELKAQAETIQSSLQMTSGIYGWPYPHM
ncbi:hypothetical protein INS49_003221 [Diaporthe citri]|uniref:uncharacterized protein n=1 Tax=Diaporthe citri TaxID=83186 RepID=UPI001C7F6A99|nr:uncharacterized protein INS49_003221 [Diaporthe citri]KAG6369002.1 hypothetical protein INS49_003221 [Diaporthe citri]